MASAQAVPECAERERLWRLYHFAVSDYSRATKVFETRKGVVSKADYDRLRKFIEESRLKSEEYRIALEKHCAEHGC